MDFTCALSRVWILIEALPTVGDTGAHFEVGCVITLSAVC